MTRSCACGCPLSMDGKRPNAIYASEACRARAYKARHNIVGYRRVKPSLNGKKRGVRWSVVTGPLAYCDCGWNANGDQDSRKALAKARKHNRETGHTVYIERGQFAILEEREAA